ncbi:MAG: nitronate monooxygenase [Oscillospiraceae bacterium]|nr:nitronate monooxygenase [Oscillospiraceae bacterium]MDD4368265.1 nitronate monooxygenase [Oscillospiraceae bacterium]
MNNRICDLFKTEYPLIQGGMAWAATAELAAAVSNAGGLGLIGSGAMTAELLRPQIRRARQLTDHNFGVNIMLMNPAAAELAQLLIEEHVPVVTTGAGSPGKFLAAWHKAGLIVVPVVASAGQAKRMENLGADAVVCEGQEAGGHIGELSSVVLWNAVAQAVSIPVIGAGGIADGRGIAAAFALGCEGVQLGTRFLASAECWVNQNYKDLVVKARDIDTVVTGRSGGHPVRALKTRLERELLKLEKNGATFEELEAISVGSLRKAVLDGDLNEGSFMAGQSAGLIKDIKPCAEIIPAMFKEASQVLSQTSTACQAWAD